MRIVHISAASPFMDESTYQETMLANKQVEMGHEVYIVATNIVFNSDGSMSLCEPKTYKNSKGVTIIRFNSHRKVGRSRGNFFELFNVLKKIRPDFIMDHVFCPTSSMAVLMYRSSNRNCKIVADSHMTEDNYDPDSCELRQIILVMLQRIIGMRYYRICHRVYGITPDTVKLLMRVFHVPEDKTEVLPLGFDDSLIDRKDQDTVRKDTRSRYGIADDKLVFIHGGKLTRGKKTLELVKSIKSVPDAALIVFGDFSDPEYEQEVRDEASDNVIFAGFLDKRQIYDAFYASDIAAFPGAPSCLRQESVACGLPIIMGNNSGDDGINIIENDNGIRLPADWTVETLSKAVSDIAASLSGYKARALELADGDFKKYSYSYEASYVLDN